MFIRENLPYLIFAFFFFVALSRLPRKIDVDFYKNLVEFKSSSTKAIKIKKDSKLRNSKQFKNREASLKNYIDKNNSSLSVEDVYTENLKILVACVFLGVLIFLIFKSPICLLLPFILGIPACYRHDYSLKHDYTERANLVTAQLPNFIMNINMVMGAGMDINPSMEVAAKTVDMKVRDEFLRLLTESRLNPDKLEKVYRDLAERIDTEEMSIFSNTVLTGLKNGTAMEQIFESEAKRLNATTITLAKMKGDKAESNATLLSTALILFPGIIVIIAPFMLSA